MKWKTKCLEDARKKNLQHVEHRKTSDVSTPWKQQTNWAGELWPPYKPSAAGWLHPAEAAQVNQIPADHLRAGWPLQSHSGRTSSEFRPIWAHRIKEMFIVSCFDLMIESMSIFVSYIHSMCYFSATWWFIVFKLQLKQQQLSVRMKKENNDFNAVSWINDMNDMNTIITWLFKLMLCKRYSHGSCVCVSFWFWRERTQKWKKVKQLWR